jgi:predicted GTPase
MSQLIRDRRLHAVVFSYSDVAHVNVMHLASEAVAAGADFWLLGAAHTMLDSRLPVISICAVRTGCGKSPVSRWVVRELKHLGWNPVVVRHPMPYGDLREQKVQRFATLADLDRHHCTIEEREEYEPHITSGTVVYAGVDYEAILRQAEKDGDLVLWDGGNNDTPFYRPDLEIVVADPHRAGHELLYYPGEVNLRRAQVLIINKVDTAEADAVDQVRENARRFAPQAEIVEMASAVTPDDAAMIKGKRVLVVEDGPTVTHGEMAYGAGVVAARESGAAEIVDPRPYAIGTIRATFAKYPHLSNILPAMGYGEQQRHELQETINAVPCDAVIVATPVDLGAILQLNKPATRVRYEVHEVGGDRLMERLDAFSAAHGSKRELELAGRHA